MSGNRLAVAAALAIALSSIPAAAKTPLGSICRVKGQEENTLHGLGIIVGLKGTGDGGDFLPTIRSLATAMELMGTSVGSVGASGKKDVFTELKDAKNVALVTVSATVPAAGARQGDQLDCVVSSVGSATSLEGGRLFTTPLLGPVPDPNRRVYAFAQGPVSLDDVEMPTTGRVHGGCRLEEDFFNAFTKDGKITLVLDTNHAEFQVAQDVAELVNTQWSLEAVGRPLAKAINQVNVEVTIPAEYRDHEVAFVSQVLSLPLLDPPTTPRVVINERTGSIVIGGDVEIGAVLVTHKNIRVETGTASDAGQFVPIDPGTEDNPKLKALVAALDAVRVPKEDIIDIIKGLDRNGKLHARLIIE